MLQAIKPDLQSIVDNYARIGNDRALIGREFEDVTGQMTEPERRKWLEGSWDDLMEPTKTQ